MRIIHVHKQEFASAPVNDAEIAARMQLVDAAQNVAQEAVVLGLYVNGSDRQENNAMRGNAYRIRQNQEGFDVAGFLRACTQST
jgi:hypothetical protein